MKEWLCSSLSCGGPTCCKPEGFTATCWESSLNCASSPWSQRLTMNLSGVGVALWPACACGRSSASQLRLQGGLTGSGTFAVVCPRLPPSAVGLSTTASPGVGEETVSLLEDSLWYSALFKLHLISTKIVTGWLNSESCNCAVCVFLSQWGREAGLTCRGKSHSCPGFLCLHMWVPGNGTCMLRAALPGSFGLLNMCGWVDLCREHVSGISRCLVTWSGLLDVWKSSTSLLLLIVPGQKCGGIGHPVSFPPSQRSLS